MGYIYYKEENQINITGFFSAVESYYTESYLFDVEAHDFWELMYVKKGNVRVSADDRVYELTEGEMIFHKPNEYHKFVKLGNTPLSFFVMSFSANGKGMERFKKYRNAKTVAYHRRNTFIFQFKLFQYSLQKGNRYITE